MNTVAPKMDMNLIQQMQQKEALYFEQKLTSELFPFGKLTQQWIEVITISMMRTTPLQNRISLKEFAEVLRCVDKLSACSGKKEITLFEFGVMSNSIETLSAHDLGLNAVEYADFIDYCTELIDYYSVRTKKIREEVKKRAEDDIKRKQVSGGLQPVKGEA